MTVQYERILLPMISDVIPDTLDMMATLKDGEMLEYFVLAVADAFFRLPLKPEEQKYFAARFHDIFFHWARVAQGSRNGPQLFGRLSAMLGRLTQGVFSADRCRVRIYTDGPSVSSCAPEATIGSTFVLLTEFRRALGLDMAARKA